MPKLEEILPKGKPRLIDLVKKAGVDVSDWENFKGGKKKAAANPKYCYEWAFVEPKKVVVLSLWHEHIIEERKDDVIITRITVREDAAKLSPLKKRRALKVDAAVQTAIKEGLPIRVIVVDRTRSGIGNPEKSFSHVSARFLDPVPWSVTQYDWQNGTCILKRGFDRFVDQFSIGEESMPERHNVSGQAFSRSSEVRDRVLLRAIGLCEWCGKSGFEMTSGRIYLETHHIVPLSENGLDRVTNVTALCANHHREAHHGKNKAEIRKKLLERFGK